MQRCSYRRQSCVVCREIVLRFAQLATDRLLYTTYTDWQLDDWVTLLVYW